MPHLVSARLTTQTGFEDKDQNTGIWLEVSADFGRLPLVKHFDFENGTEYADQSWNYVDLPLLAKPEKSECVNGLGARIGIRGRKNPNVGGGENQWGNDEWELQPWVELTFDDGSIVTVSGGVFRLNSRGNLDEKNFATVTEGSSVPPEGIRLRRGPR